MLSKREVDLNGHRTKERERGSQQQGRAKMATCILCCGPLLRAPTTHGKTRTCEHISTPTWCSDLHGALTSMGPHPYPGSWASTEGVCCLNLVSLSRGFMSGFVGLSSLRTEAPTTTTTTACSRVLGLSLTWMQQLTGTPAGACWCTTQSDPLTRDKPFTNCQRWIPRGEGPPNRGMEIISTVESDKECSCPAPCSKLNGVFTRASWIH